MFRFFWKIILLLICCGPLHAAEVEVQSKNNTAPSPKQEELPKYRPALLGTGANALINRIDSVGLIKRGQKNGSVMFCCAVTKTGNITHAWTYRATPDSKFLADEVLNQAERTKFIPAVYNHHPVDILFYGTVTFAIVDDRPRLRIFANQEEAEVKKESDFIAPQPFVGLESKFEGLHYPDDILRVDITGLVEMTLKVDADGNMKELRRVSEEPPLVGFGRAAAEDFRVARFVPAFRDGKPVECSVTLYVYYEP